MEPEIMTEAITELPRPIELLGTKSWSWNGWANSFGSLYIHK
jgi:hypothetical protein